MLDSRVIGCWRGHNHRLVKEGTWLRASKTQTRRFGTMLTEWPAVRVVLMVVVWHWQKRSIDARDHYVVARGCQRESANGADRSLLSQRFQPTGRVDSLARGPDAQQRRGPSVKTIASLVSTLLLASKKHETVMRRLWFARTIFHAAECPMHLGQFRFNRFALLVMKGSPYHHHSSVCLDEIYQTSFTYREK